MPRVEASLVSESGMFRPAGRWMIATTFNTSVLRPLAFSQCRGFCRTGCRLSDGMQGTRRLDGRGTRQQVTGVNAK